MLHLRVRRFFCTTVDCARKIFCEQVDGLTSRHGRISELARRLLAAVATALGGRAAAQVADRWHLLKNLRFAAMGGWGPQAAADVSNEKIRIPSDGRYVLHDGVEVLALESHAVIKDHSDVVQDATAWPLYNLVAA